MVQLIYTTESHHRHINDISEGKSPTSIRGRITIENCYLLKGSTSGEELGKRLFNGFYDKAF